MPMGTKPASGSSMLSIQENSRGITFKVFIQPKSAKNMIAGLHGDAIKIKLTAPPVDGAANKMCIQYLAKCLNVSKSSLEIISGQTSRTKQILLRYAGESDLEKELNRLKALIISLLKPQKTP
jgi:uncharacterized protein (TIGR00251 family)